MFVGLGRTDGVSVLHWVCLPAMGCFAGSLWLLRVRARVYLQDRLRDKRFRGEIEAYARFDARLPPDGNARVLGDRVCRMVAEKSFFHRVALLTRDAAGRIYVAASIGMDSATIKALQAWGLAAVEEEERAGGEGIMGARRGGLGPKSWAVVLEASEANPGCGRAIVAPLWTGSGRMAGALVVCADSMMSVRRRTIVEAVNPLEILAMKLGRAIENAAVVEKLMKAEKLSGLGLLADGVAHALNNPLTAVLGFAELIGETSAEPRVRTNAATIVSEARRMREMLERLLNFWRPTVHSYQHVRVADLVREIAVSCREKMANREIRLVVEVDEETPSISGNEERLRQVLEHLLNNAAQAISSQFDENSGVRHIIRITVTHDIGGVQVIVSDTGPGFTEIGRAFDPFYTTRQPGDGAGLGLSICYGIVREHGGEISAFNLHPRGAAVVVELPIHQRVMRDFDVLAEEAREVA